MSTNIVPPPAPAAAPVRKKPWWILWVLLTVLFLGFGACSIITVATLGASSTTASNSTFTETTYHEDGFGSDKLAVVFIEGMITGRSKSAYRDSMAEAAIKKINAATDDPTIKGLLLYLNTPGGEVTASDKIYNAVKQFSETERPVVAYMDTVAASGGYYIACGADEIVANETSITGSIGVIISGFNASEMLDNVGIKGQTFRSGDFKDTLSMTREMRDDEREYIQALVDDMYEKFAGIVSEAREIPMETLKDGIADGRIFQGSAAKEVGLVDKTGYEADAIEALKDLAGISNAKIIKYQTEPSIGDFLGILGAKAQEDTTVKVDWGQGQFTQEMKPLVPYSVLPGY